MNQENRTYARTNTRLRGFARKVHNPDLPSLLNQVEVGDGLPETIIKESKLPEGLGTLLLQINNKLDMLLNLMGRDFIEKDFPIQTEIIELSAAGLRCLYPTGYSFELGEYLEFVLLLSYLPLRMVGVVGLIHRVEIIQGEQVLAIKFTSLRESAREEIVQFVFSEQREQIRTLKRD